MAARAAPRWCASSPRAWPAPGLNVLLVDADMRTAGLTTSIAARGADLTELVRAKDVPPATPWGRGRLTVVPSPKAVADKEIVPPVAGAGALA